MEFIKVEEQQQVLQIQLNRPDKKNAFHPQMIEELTSAFQSVKNSAARYIHLCAAGESFCAGADLHWMQSMKDYSFEENKKDSLLLFKMFETMSQCPLPITAKVKGHVMGGANGLIAMCDIVAAEHSTQFAFSEVRLGLIPAVISPFVLSKMHKPAARSLMVTGRVFSSEEAYKGGLIEFKGDEVEVDEFLASVHKSILTAGPEAVRETIHLLGEVENCFEWEQVRDLTTTAIAKKRISEEGQEGLTAFFAKRKPAWLVKK
ncbi:MAG: enoyl-CoA hydratase/isomerase family protein [Bdellovibrionales bacterium]|nr:enoyl-CoA hydratase/isomerase family protein [Bdellovibrionales bacterium]